MKKQGLGKGLQALMGETLPTAGDMLTELDIDLIDPNPLQPRKRFDKEKLEELAESIGTVGVIQPILVYQNGQRYVIVAGERRWRAARLAKLRTVPVIVRQWDRIRQMEVALVENLQRDDLNCVEEAQAVRALMDECGLTQEAVSARLGKSRSAVANLLRLLQLEEELMELLRQDKLSEGHARALLPLPAGKQRLQIAKQLIAQGWSVRKTEQIVAQLLAQDKPEEKKKTCAPEIRTMEQAVRRATGSRVSIVGTSKKGKVCIHYGSYEEFERLYDWMAQHDGGAE